MKAKFDKCRPFAKTAAKTAFKFLLLFPPVMGLSYLLLYHVLLPLLNRCLGG